MVLIRSALVGASNEYPQHMFSWRNKKNINTLIEKSALTSAMAYVIFFLIFFIKICCGLVGTHLNCLHKSIKTYVVGNHLNQIALTCPGNSNGYQQHMLL